MWKMKEKPRLQAMWRIRYREKYVCRFIRDELPDVEGWILQLEMALD
jgi:hypothetical protein